MRTLVCMLCDATFTTNSKGLIRYCENCRPISRKLKEIGRSARRRIPCPICGQPMSYQSRWCRSCWYKKCKELNIFPRGAKHHWYKNGRPKTSEGYIRIKRPDHPFADHNGYIAEHRFVMEQHLGRILDRKEFVHHLNGIRNDNRLRNLAVVSPSNHSSNTLKKAFQKRIRDLEAELAQQKF